MHASVQAHQFSSFDAHVKRLSMLEVPGGKIATGESGRDL
jgi:hypothetical protein